MLRGLTHLTLATTLPDRYYYDSVLYTRKQRLGEVNQITQGHTASVKRVCVSRQENDGCFVFPSPIDSLCAPTLLPRPIARYLGNQGRKHSSWSPALASPLTAYCPPIPGRWEACPPGPAPSQRPLPCTPRFPENSPSLGRPPPLLPGPTPGMAFASFLLGEQLPVAPGPGSEAPHQQGLPGPAGSLRAPFTH